MRPGVRPTQLRATAEPGPAGGAWVAATRCSCWLTSDNNGPCREDRTVIVRGCSSPATWICSVTVFSGRAVPHPDLVSVDRLEIEVLHVEIAGGQSPGDGGVVPDHHPGHRGQAEPGHVLGAGVGDRMTV